MNLAKATGDVENTTSPEVHSNNVNTVQKTGASSGLLGSSTNSISNSSENVNANQKKRSYKLLSSNHWQLIFTQIYLTSQVRTATVLVTAAFSTPRTHLFAPAPAQTRLFEAQTRARCRC